MVRARSKTHDNKKRRYLVDRHARLDHRAVRLARHALGRRRPRRAAARHVVGAQRLVAPHARLRHELIVRDEAHLLSAATLNISSQYVISSCIGGRWPAAHDQRDANSKCRRRRRGRVTRHAFRCTNELAMVSDGIERRGEVRRGSRLGTHLQAYVRLEPAVRQLDQRARRLPRQEPARPPRPAVSRRAARRRDRLVSVGALVDMASK